MRAAQPAHQIKERRVKMKKTIIAIAVAAMLLGSVSLFAANVSGKRHPNLKAAQVLIEKAVKRVSAAQVANEFDMDGHAAKAKDLLDQAYAEIKLAAEAANQNAK
jgi:hypothetical protein